MADRFRCRWETVMPGQMEQFVCRCGNVLLAKGTMLSRGLDRLLVGGHWKFTGAYYVLPQGGATEDNFLRAHEYQEKKRTKGDVSAFVRRMAREAVRGQRLSCGRRR